MRKPLVLIISCFMAALLVTPLSLASRGARSLQPAAGTTTPAGRALSSPAAQQEATAGDPATLVGQGQAEAGTAFAEPQSEVNIGAVGSVMGMPSEHIEELEEHEE